MTTRSKRRLSAEEPRPGYRYGADGFYLRDADPALLCPRCQNDRREPPCPYCHGIGAILAPTFGPTPPKRPVKRLSDEQVTALRSLGCPLEGYPAEGTPAWTRFQQESAESRRKKNAMLDRLPKRPNLRRGRGKRQVITRAP